MIHYDLNCAEGHHFDGWFPSAAGFEAQRDAGLIACSICGTTQIDRALMAPNVSVARSDKGSAADTLLSPDQPSPLERLRKEIEANSDYVGLRFVDEARAMHEGRSEARAIHGEAKPAEAAALLQEGVPIAPLPFIPKRRQN